MRLLKFNAYADREKVEQNPLNYMSAEEIFRSGVVPSQGTEVTFNGLSIGQVGCRASDDIFGCIRDGVNVLGNGQIDPNSNNE